MKALKFNDLTASLSDLSDQQASQVREHLATQDGVITLDINCGRRAYELNAANELAETLERVGLAESLDILKAWEGGQRG